MALVFHERVVFPKNLQNKIYPKTFAQIHFEQKKKVEGF